MRAAYDTYQDRGFEILSVSVQEGDAEVADFIDRYDLAYPFLMDRTGEIASAYAVTTTPTTYFIAPDGSIADSTAGIVTQGWLASNIERTLTS